MRERERETVLRQNERKREIKERMREKPETK